MLNDSSTGGYLVPAATPVVDDDRALRLLLQTVIVGVTGLAPTLVRPSWQRNPPPIPAVDVDWIGFGVTAQRPDFDPYMEHVTRDEESAMKMNRHETIEIACVCYGDNCKATANAIRDGLHIAQNREALYLAGMGFVGVSDLIPAPELINDQWVDRADVTLTLRREVRREYPILHFLSAVGSIAGNRAETTLTEEWSAGEQP